ncbi:hypothetical protein PAXINDRAFT_104216 [Paxillus involutus ATCC 200175]|uniref:Uncharacterized protein n=1 Tax=Paxillus involutus ATCC 200175 TaxID=664439 RepID=A0A0C9T7S1_PAXIN|nr:hypothetical protein PAXINDRAFT_104216 [Paxillus involutus ATCC 200175]
MPKRSRKVHTAIENLGPWAKKQKTLDKENKGVAAVTLNIAWCSQADSESTVPLPCGTSAAPQRQSSPEPLGETVAPHSPATPSSNLKAIHDMFPPPHSVFSQLENTPTGIEHGGQSHLWSASHSPTFKLRGNLSDHGGDNQSSSEDGSGEEWDNDEEEGGMEGENPNEGYDGCEELCRAVTAAALTANSKGIATVTVMGAGNSGNDALVMPSGSDVGRTSPSQTGVFPGPSTSRGNDNHRACVDDAEDETGSPWHSIDVRTHNAVV